MEKSGVGFKILLLNLLPLGFLSLLSHSCAKLYLYLHLLKVGMGSSRDQRLVCVVMSFLLLSVAGSGLHSWWLLAAGAGELTHSVAMLQLRTGGVVRRRQGLTAPLDACG